MITRSVNPIVAARSLALTVVALETFSLKVVRASVDQQTCVRFVQSFSIEPDYLHCAHYALLIGVLTDTLLSNEIDELELAIYGHCENLIGCKAYRPEECIRRILCRINVKHAKDVEIIANRLMGGHVLPRKTLLQGVEIENGDLVSAIESEAWTRPD